MRRKIGILAVLVMLFSQGLHAEGTGGFTRSEYIEMWKDEAIYQMVVHKIPASITLAQGILESGNGNSSLATKANNHFGIKCHSTWDGMRVYHDDDKKGECFRHYPDAKQSYEDHSIFLKQPRYQGLYDHKITDYKAWAKGLKKAGYATDPSYAKRLIDLIEQNNLTQYDKEGVDYIKKGKTPERKDDGRKTEEKPPKERENKSDRPKSKKDRSGTELPEVNIQAKRAIRTSKNNVAYILAEHGDTFESIAVDLEMMPWQIRKYNDMEKGQPIQEGQLIYIKPKRGKAKAEWHVVQEGESLWDISQEHGVKLSKLRKKNLLGEGQEPVVGDKISLRQNLK